MKITKMIILFRNLNNFIFLFVHGDKKNWLNHICVQTNLKIYLYKIMDITFLMFLIILLGCIYVYSENVRHTYDTELYHVKLENYDLKNKIEYLQNYKNDVSKTFQILDNDLTSIKENIVKSQTQTLPLLTMDNIQELLSNIDNMEFSNMQPTETTSAPIAEPIQEIDALNVATPSSSYDKYRIN